MALVGLGILLTLNMKFSTARSRRPGCCDSRTPAGPARSHPRRPCSTRPSRRRACSVSNVTARYRLPSSVRIFSVLLRRLRPGRSRASFIAVLHQPIRCRVSARARRPVHPRGSRGRAQVEPLFGAGTTSCPLSHRPARGASASCRVVRGLGRDLEERLVRAVAVAGRVVIAPTADQILTSRVVMVSHVVLLSCWSVSVAGCLTPDGQVGQRDSQQRTAASPELVIVLPAASPASGQVPTPEQSCRA